MAATTTTVVSASATDEPKGRYETLVEEEICKSVSKTDPNIVTYVMSRVRHFKETAKAVNECKNHVFLMKEKCRVDDEQHQTDYKLMGQFKMSVPNLQKVKNVMVKSMQMLRGICESFEDTFSRENFPSMDAYLKKFAHYMGTAHGCLIGVALPNDTRQINQNKILYQKMIRQKNVDHESVLHMNNLVSFTNPQSKRNEQDEFAVVLLGSKDYHKENVACEKRLDMGAIFQRVVTGTKEPVGTVLSLNGAQTKSLVAYLLNPDTQLNEYFPLALELDASIDTIANGLLVPVKVPNALNVVFPGDNPLAKCLSNDTDQDVIPNYVMNTPTRSLPPPSPIKRVKQARKNVQQMMMS